MPPVEDFLPENYVDRDEQERVRNQEQAAAAVAEGLATGPLDAGDAYRQRLLADARQRLARGDMVGAAVPFAQGTVQGMRQSPLGYTGTPAVLQGLLAIPEGVVEGTHSVGRAVALPLEWTGVPGAAEYRAQSADDEAERYLASEGMGLVGRAARGAARTVTEMAALRGVGQGAGALAKFAGAAPRVANAITIAAGSAPVAVSQASSTADREGLTGGAKLGYIVANAGTEVVASVLGGGGAERILTGLGRDGAEEAIKAALRPVVSSVARELGGEVVEENLTELAQGFIDHWMLPSNRDQTAGEAFSDWVASIPETTLTALFAAGPTTVARETDPRVRAERLRAAVEAQAQAQAAPAAQPQTAPVEEAPAPADMGEEQAPSFVTAPPAEVAPIVPAVQTTKGQTGTAEALSSAQVTQALDRAQESIYTVDPSASIERLDDRIVYNRGGIQIDVVPAARSEMQAAASSATADSLWASLPPSVRTGLMHKKRRVDFNTFASMSPAGRTKLLHDAGVFPNGLTIMRRNDGGETNIPLRALVYLDTAAAVEVLAEEINHSDVIGFMQPDETRAFMQILGESVDTADIMAGRPVNESNAFVEGVWRLMSEYKRDQEGFITQLNEAVGPDKQGFVQRIAAFFRRFFDALRGAKAAVVPQGAAAEAIVNFLEGSLTGEVAKRPAQPVTQKTLRATDVIGTQRTEAQRRVAEREQRKAETERKRAEREAETERNAVAKRQREEERRLAAEEAPARAQVTAREKKRQATMAEQSAALVERRAPVNDRIAEIRAEITSLKEQIAKTDDPEAKAALRGEQLRLGTLKDKLNAVKTKINSRIQTLEAGRAVAAKVFTSNMADANNLMAQEAQARAMEAATPEQRAATEERIAGREDVDTAMGREEGKGEGYWNLSPVERRDKMREAIRPASVAEAVPNTEEQPRALQGREALDRALQAIFLSNRAYKDKRTQDKITAEAEELLRKAERGQERFANEVSQRIMSGKGVSAAEVAVLRSLKARAGENLTKLATANNPSALSAVERANDAMYRALALSGEEWSHIGHALRDPLTGPAGRREKLINSLMALNAFGQGRVNRLVLKAKSLAAKGRTGAASAVMRQADKLRADLLRDQKKGVVEALERAGYDPAEVFSAEYDPADEGADGFFNLMTVVGAGKVASTGWVRHLAINVPAAIIPFFAGNLIGLGSAAVQTITNPALAAILGGEAFVKSAATDIAAMFAGKNPTAVKQWMAGAEAAARSIGEAITNAGFAFMTGRSPVMARLSLEDQAHELDGANDAISKLLGKVQSPALRNTLGLAAVPSLRLLAGVDEVFQTIAMRAAMATRSLQVGSERGLRGQELADFVKAQSNEATQDDDVVSRVFIDVTRATSKRPWNKHTMGGTFMAGLQTFVDAPLFGFRPFRVAAPFLLTPVRIAEEAARRNPIMAAVYLAHDFDAVLKANKKYAEGSLDAEKRGELVRDMQNQILNMAVYSAIAGLLAAALDDDELDELAAGRIDGYDITKLDPPSLILQGVASTARALKSGSVEALTGAFDAAGKGLVEVMPFGPRNRFTSSYGADSLSETTTQQVDRMLTIYGGLRRDVGRLFDPGATDFNTGAPKITATGEQRLRRPDTRAAAVAELFRIGVPVDDPIVSKLASAPRLDDVDDLAREWKFTGVDPASDLGVELATRAGSMFRTQLESLDFDWRGDKELTPIQVRHLDTLRDRVSKMIRRMNAARIREATGE